MLPIREVTKDKIPEQSQRKQDRNKTECKQNAILYGKICPKYSSTFIKDMMFQEVEKNCGQKYRFFLQFKDCKSYISSDYTL